MIMPIFNAKPTTIMGYETAELVSVVIAKNRILRENLKAKKFQLTEHDLRIFIYLSLIPDAEKLNILDFGGGGGNLAAITKHFLPHKSLNWVIVETDAMADAAQREFQSDHTTWISEIPTGISDIGKFDLVIASSSVQYTEDPINTIEQIMNLQPRYIVINRTPLLFDTSSPQKYIQKSWLSSNGPGNLPENFKNKSITYPIFIPRENEVESLLLQSYQIIFKVPEGQVELKGVPFPLSYFGYFLKKL